MAALMIMKAEYLQRIHKPEGYNHRNGKQYRPHCQDSNRINVKRNPRNEEKIDCRKSQHQTSRQQPLSTNRIHRIPDVGIFHRFLHPEPVQSIGRNFTHNQRHGKSRQKRTTEKKH